MIAFKISLNGEAAKLAAAPDLGVLTLFATASGRLGPLMQPTYAHQTGYDIRLNIGGLTSRGSNYRDEFVDWVDLSLKPGDTVRIEIIDSDAADPPVRRKPLHARRRDFPKRPRKSPTSRFDSYTRKLKHGIKTIYD